MKGWVLVGGRSGGYDQCRNGFSGARGKFVEVAESSSQHENVAVQKKTDAAEHLLFFDVLLPGQGVTDASGQGFVEGRR